MLILRASHCCSAHSSVSFADRKKIRWDIIIVILSMYFIIVWCLSAYAAIYGIKMTDVIRHTVCALNGVLVW